MENHLDQERSPTRESIRGYTRESTRESRKTAITTTNLKSTSSQPNLIGPNLIGPPLKHYTNSQVTRL